MIKKMYIVRVYYCGSIYPEPDENPHDDDLEDITISGPEEVNIIYDGAKSGKDIKNGINCGISAIPDRPIADLDF